VSNSQDKVSTREKIITCAAGLFAKKGFTETTIRDLAAAVGIKGASLYNHFPSKNAILDYILDDYTTQNTDVFLTRDIPSILRNNPTPDGILECMQLSFPEGRVDYYLNVLCVLMQEQHRNPVIRGFVTGQFITQVEKNIKTVMDALKMHNIIRKDADPDYWVKTCSSLMYTFASRLVLGVGDGSQGFTGRGMIDMLRSTFELMLKTCKSG
jgi:AcrR family transcriptional regulator